MRASSSPVGERHMPEQKRAASRYTIPVGSPDQHALVLCVGIGVTHSRAALVNSNGELVGKPVSQRQSPLYAKRRAGEVFAEALAVAEQAAGATSVDRLAALAVIVPAGVRRKTGLIYTAPKIMDLTSRRLPRSFQRFGVPVFIENDANSALLFEHHYGAAQGLSSVLGVHLVSGLGGALIVDGRLVVGRHGHATEIGHVPLNRGEGRACPCGANQDCFELYASGGALWKAAQDRQSETGQGIPGREGNYMDIVYAARKGNSLALDLMDQFATDLADGLVAVLNTFDPVALVFTGVLSSAQDLFLEKVKKTAEAKCFADIGTDTDFRVSVDPFFCDLRGAPVVAAGQPIEHWEA